MQLPAIDLSQLRSGAGHDALDALAVAIAQAHYRETAAKLGQVA